MKKLCTLLLLAISLPALAHEYKYGERVAFTGRIRTMHGGWPAIVLDKPITVVANPEDNDGIDSTEAGVKMMHLAMSSSEHFQQYRQFKGKKARVECQTLFHSITMYHKTPVLCAVAKISAPNRP